MTDEARGPGETQYIPNDDGSISCRRWNDPAWTTHLVDAEPVPAWRIAYLLRQAYLEGFDDRATLIRSALGVKQ